MEIIFIPKNTADDLMNYSIEEIQSSHLDEIKKDLESINSSYSLKEINLGTGADWALILAIISGISGVFMLGDKIETGIAGWIKVGKRIKSLFGKTDKIYLDLDAAKILALEYISQTIEIKSMTVIDTNVIELLDLSTMLRDRKPTDFIAKPYAVYMLTFRINENIQILLSVRSDGEIKEIYKFDDEFLLPF